MESPKVVTSSLFPGDVIDFSRRVAKNLILGYIFWEWKIRKGWFTPHFVAKE